MTPQERFNRSLKTGDAASPFRLAAVTVKFGNGEILTVPNVQGETGTNEVEHKEYGDPLTRTISVSIPKDQLPNRRPKEHNDLLICNGIEWKISHVDGEDACSPFWLITGNAPL